MTDLERRRLLLELGARAVTYYIDTGLCVFCNADDVRGVPHEECSVGAASGIRVTESRREECDRTRRLLDEKLFGAEIVATEPEDCDACYALSPGRCEKHLLRRVGTE